MDATLNTPPRLHSAADLTDLAAAIVEECRHDVVIEDDAAEALVEAALDALVEMSLLVPSERWDEECHRCESRVGDHTLDGRCPVASVA